VFRRIGFGGVRESEVKLCGECVLCPGHQKHNCAGGVCREL
jgi:hypothetical protein